MTTYTEEELLYLLKQKDPTGYAYLYKCYSTALYGIISRKLVNVVLAEDILQDTFILIWNNIHKYDPAKGRLFTWMVTIARNLSTDTMRSKWARNNIKTDYVDIPAINISDGYNAAYFDSLGMTKHLKILKDEHRVLIDLAYFHCLTQDEISKYLSIPIGTVKTRLRAAIVELRKLLHPSYNYAA